MAVLSCAPEKLDVQTQTCSEPVWVEIISGGMPPLSVADAALLASSVIALWCIGAAFKLARRSMQR